MDLCPDYNICTDQLTPDSHLCKGDFGSPLYNKGCNHAKYPRCLMGVASHYVEDKSDRKRKQSVDYFNSGNYFSNIPYFYDWILEIVNDHNLNDQMYP